MNRCERCQLQTRMCICDEVPHVPTRTRVVIVRHALEAHKPSNSGRLLARALPHSELCDYGAPDAPFCDAPLRRDGTWVLFPAARATAAVPEPAPRQIVALDASWPQARRMYQRIDALRGLPVLALPPPEQPPDQLRTPPRSDGRSTADAVARALELLEGSEVAAPIDRIYALMVARSRATARYQGR